MSLTAPLDPSSSLDRPARVQVRSSWLQRLPARTDQMDRIIGVLCGLIALAVYGGTRVRELLPFDGGEFQFLAINGGHAHVTGYGVYLTLLHAFSALPLGDPILRATLFSSVMGALAVTLAYLIGRAVSRWRVAGVALAVAWGGASTVWSQAVQAEVYTTAAVFTAAIAWCVIRWLQNGGAWRLVLAGVLGGASLGVHGSVGLFAPGIGLALLAAKINRRTSLLAIGGAVAGVVIFLAAFWNVDHRPRRHDVFENVYLPWSAAFGASERDLSTPPERLLFLMKATQWQKSMFASPARAVPRNSFWYLRVLARDFTVLWLGLVAVGICLAVVRARPFATLLIVGLLFHHFYSFNYEIPDLYVFFIPAFLYMGIAATYGAGALLDLAHSRSFRPTLFGAVALLVIAAAGAQPLQKAGFIRDREATGLINDLPSHAELTQQRHAIERLVQELPRDALVATNWSMLYRFIYLSGRAGRSDLRFIEARPWGIEGIDLPTYHARLQQLAGTDPLIINVPEKELAELGYQGEWIGKVGAADFWKIR